MLKHIQDIKAIGPFLDDHPANVQFEPLTFIYGENCYGKTTLCDIFRSLDENSPEYLTIRESVPNPDGHRQHVQLGLVAPGASAETPFIFDGNAWNPTLPAGTRLLVFDTDFIHRNVFTGQVIERRNRENLTNFILGDAGRVKAERIGQLTSHLRALSRDIQQQQADNFVGIENINTFIALVVDKTPVEIQGIIDSLTNQNEDKRALLENLSSAAGRAEPRLLGVPDEFQPFVRRVNDCLIKTYQRAHLDAARTVSTHIQQKTMALPNTEQWISHGLDHLHNEDCPFCGQDLNDQAQILLAAYREHFDAAFSRFVTDVTEALHHLPGELDVFRNIGLRQQIMENALAITEYPELAKDVSFAQFITQHNLLSKEVIGCWESWQTQCDSASQLLTNRINTKREAIHIGVDEWDCQDAISTYAILAEKALSYNQLLDLIIGRVSEFKRGLNAGVLSHEITALESQRAELLLMLRRQQSADVCVRYAELVKDRSDTSTLIDTLRKELDEEQAQFLEDYFDSINSLFSSLGSSSFSISKVQTRRGNRPVVGLAATYSGVPISPEKLPAFFSESDRRALALSIFWAKAHLMTEQEKEASVLILDDPVTSFDEGRIERTIRLIDGARTSFRQVIVLSHYPRFLKSFFDRAHFQSGSIQVARIFKTQNSSKLETASIIDFTETEHQAKLRHIVNFIENQHREDICLDLRVFLEEEVRSRYGKQILDSRITSTGFRDLLDALKDSGAISEELRNEIEPFRLSLNPGHHTWVGGTHENKVAFASDVLDFVYSRL